MRIEQALHPVIGVGAVVLLLLILGDAGTPASPLAHLVLGWLILAISLLFVLEFVLRVVIAPSTWAYLKSHWWQIPLLVLPFLSFIRIFMALRLARTGRVFMAVERGARSAGQKFRSRIAWLGAITAIVVLSATDLLLEYGGYGGYNLALHDAAMTTISGASLGIHSGVAQALDPVLALYSVIVFAGLAATLGALFLEHRPGAHPPGDGVAEASVEVRR